MVTNVKLEAIATEKHGYPVGLKRRRNAKLTRWLAALNDSKWSLEGHVYRFFENTKGLAHEQGIAGEYMIATSESALSVLEVVAIYKELSHVERGFRQPRDVQAMRPLYHQIEPGVKACILVAALSLLVQRLLHRRLEDAGIDFSPEPAMQALSTLRLVTLRLEAQPQRRGVSEGRPDARRVLRALGGSELRPPNRLNREKTVVQ
jgi:hypothetical protein